ncbi:MAG: tetratricopeptide repeat protein [Planctomycetota bacterium]
MTASVLPLLVFGTGMPVSAQGTEWKTLNDEVMSLYKQGHYDRAIIVGKKALEAAERALGPDHLDLAQILNNLAELYLAQGQFAQAEPLCKRALSISEKALGANQLDVATSLNTLARVYDSQRQYAQAEPLFKRSSRQ